MRKAKSCAIDVLLVVILIILVLLIANSKYDPPAPTPEPTATPFYTIDETLVCNDAGCVSIDRRVYWTYGEQHHEGQN